MKIFPILSAAVVLLLGSGCSVLFSAVDKVKPVYIGGRIEEAKLPSGFVVSPQEVWEVVPRTKYGWNLYADRRNYYLSSKMQKLTSKTGDNSYLAKRYGIRISGTTREDIEKVRAHAARASTGRVRSEATLRDALQE